MKKWMMLVGLCGYGLSSVAQVSRSLLLDLGGPAGLASVHYERDIAQWEKAETNVSIGLGSFKLIDYQNQFNPDLICPVSVQQIWGIGKHRIVTGLGAVFSNFVFATVEKPKRKWGVNYFARLGYRFVPQKAKRSIFQLAYVPIVGGDGYFRNWAAATVGIKLGKL